GNGNGTFQSEKLYGTGGYPRSLVVTDLNGDGVPDLAVGQGYGYDIAFFGQGDGTFSSAEFLYDGNPGYNSASYSTATGAIDGEGIPDIISSFGNSPNVNVLQGFGYGSFSIPLSFLGTPYSPAVGGMLLADLNGDGRPDVLDNDGTYVNVLINNNNGDF